MNLSFDSRELRDVCENDLLAERKFGVEVAAVLRRRLADLRAANTLLDMVVGRPDLNGVTAQRIDISVGETHLMKSRIDHYSYSRTKDGAVNWKAVHRMKVVSVERRLEV